MAMAVLYLQYYTILYPLNSQRSTRSISVPCTLFSIMAVQRVTTTMVFQVDCWQQSFPLPVSNPSIAIRVVLTFRMSGLLPPKTKGSVGREDDLKMRTSSRAHRRGVFIIDTSDCDLNRAVPNGSKRDNYSHDLKMPRKSLTSVALIPSARDSPILVITGYDK
jgi:hypothetical protein